MENPIYSHSLDEICQLSSASENNHTEVELDR